MIERLQNGEKGAAQATVQGQTKAERTLQKVEKADQTLNEINQAVASTKEMNAQIATATEEQGVVAEEINRNVVAIDDLSVQSAQGGEETAKASIEQARLAERTSLTVFPMSAAFHTTCTRSSAMCSIFASVSASPEIMARACPIRRSRKNRARATIAVTLTPKYR